MKAYKDKHGKTILPGMMIRHDSGRTEKVFYTQNIGTGELDLGYLATNPAYLRNHPNCEPEYYTLNYLDLKEWEVV